jgi:hypothetical protein
VTSPLTESSARDNSRAISNSKDQGTIEHGWGLRLEDLHLLAFGLTKYPRSSPLTGSCLLQPTKRQKLSHNYAFTRLSAFLHQVTTQAGGNERQRLLIE